MTKSPLAESEATGEGGPRALRGRRPWCDARRPTALACCWRAAARSAATGSAPWERERSHGGTAHWAQAKKLDGYERRTALSVDCVPLAFETHGSWDVRAVAFLQKLMTIHANAAGGQCLSCQSRCNGSAHLVVSRHSTDRFGAWAQIYGMGKPHQKRARVGYPPKNSWVGYILSLRAGCCTHCGA